MKMVLQGDENGNYLQKKVREGRGQGEGGSHKSTAKLLVCNNQGLDRVVP